jgi:nucleotide-binding universal stress UspA family protein
MKQIRSILFPTDFSAVANSSLPLAVAIAAPFGATIDALHIAAAGDPHVTETTRFEFPKPAADGPQVRMTETIAPKEGEPTDIIMKAASRKEADLIVMASHGRSDVAQFFLGRSVAERVARDSLIPTIIARLYGTRRTTRPIDRLSSIIYVTDLHEESRAILPITVSIAKRTGASLRTLLMFGEGDVQPADGGRETLARFFAEAGASHVQPRAELVEGGVGDALIEYASVMEADLIAITTAIGNGGDATNTDVAEFIIRNAPCPVLCVHP